MSAMHRIERAVNVITARPLAWLLYCCWLALQHGWLATARWARWLRGRWQAWRQTRREQSAISEPRSKREVGMS